MDLILRLEQGLFLLGLSLAFSFLDNTLCFGFRRTDRRFGGLFPMRNTRPKCYRTGSDTTYEKAANAGQNVVQHGDEHLLCSVLSSIVLLYKAILPRRFTTKYAAVSQCKTLVPLHTKGVFQTTRKPDCRPSGTDRTGKSFLIAIGC